MKGIPVIFTRAELDLLYLRNRKVSLTRFKRVLREKVRSLLPEHIRASEAIMAHFEIGRVAIRKIDPKHPKDFFLDVSCVSSEVTCWRQTLLYRFNDPAQSLSGLLLPGRRRYAK